MYTRDTSNSELRDSNCICKILGCLIPIDLHELLLNGIKTGTVFGSNFYMIWLQKF